LAGELAALHEAFSDLPQLSDEYKGGAMIQLTGTSSILSLSRNMNLLAF
jgi:hypothetical protein